VRDEGKLGKPFILREKKAYQKGMALLLRRAGDGKLGTRRGKGE